MRLKDGAWAVIGAMLMLLFMGYISNGLVFYGAVLLLAILLAADGVLMWAMRADVRKVSVSRSLSRHDVAPGLSSRLTARLTYHGHRTLKILVTQPMYRSIASGFTAKPLTMAEGCTDEIVMDLTPSKYGEFTIRPLRASFESWLFRDSQPLGDDRLSFHVALGRSPIRRDHMSRFSAIIDNITLRLGGTDFSKMRPYTAGDNAKNIDWALSGKAGTLIVREYEDERTVPVFFLLDVDASMGVGDRTELDSAVGMTGMLMDMLFMGNERVGLACFTRVEIIHYLRIGMGWDHMASLKNVLSSVKPVESSGADPARTTPVQELRQVGRAFSVLDTVIDETLKGYMANITKDGFSQAILQVSQSTSTACNIVVMTNLSMGVTSLLNGIRMANYYGHSVSVVLTPHIWHEGKDLADPGRYYERYAELKDAMLRLRGYSVKVIDLSSAEKPEDIIQDSRGRSRVTGIRG
ncbi:MAG TPA: DUF58 domain-containing protein [Methanocellaceae archaeon]